MAFFCKPVPRASTTVSILTLLLASTAPTWAQPAVAPAVPAARAAAPVPAAVPTTPSPGPAAQAPDGLRAEVLRTIDQVLATRPDLIADAVVRDRQNMRQERQALALQALGLAQLEASMPGYAAAQGSTSAARTIFVVESFECAPCRDLHEELFKRAAGGARVTFRVLPTVREDGHIASQSLAAAARQNKWREMHQALHAAPGALSAEAVQKAAETAGLDFDQMIADMQAAPAQLASARDGQLKNLLAARAAPTVVIDGRNILEAPSVEDLRKALDTPAASPVLAPPPASAPATPGR